MVTVAMLSCVATVQSLTVRLQLSLYLIVVRDTNKCIDPRILKLGTNFKVRV